MPARTVRLCALAGTLLALGACASQPAQNTAMVHPRGSGNTVATDALGSRMVSQKIYAQSRARPADTATAFVNPQ